MPQVEDIKILNIDDVPHAVDAMSAEVKQMVAIYNEWNQKLADAKDHFFLVQAATNDLSRQIIAQVRKEKEEGESAAAETQVETADATTVGDLEAAGPAE